MPFLVSTAHCHCGWMISLGVRWYLVPYICIVCVCDVVGTDCSEDDCNVGKVEQESVWGLHGEWFTFVACRR